jgi:DNA repair ATPase RecN
MRYIESVHIQNFQSYKDETIHFKPGLNLLLGSSDSGKSAILRAISFVLYNYPRSHTIIHNGEKEAKVSIKFSDGTIVTRIKGERNAYLAQDKNGKKYSFDKIDKSIPEEIKSLLNFPPEDDFNGLISYADQFSPMFLVDLSPSDLPRSLSNLTGIEMLEECAKQLMQNYKILDKQIKSEEKTYLDLLNEYHSYDSIEDDQQKLTNINLNYEKLDNLSIQLSELEKYDLNLNETDENLLLKISQIIQNCDVVFSKIEKVESLINKLEDLQLFSLISFDYSVHDLNNTKSLIAKSIELEAIFKNCWEKIKSEETLAKIQHNYEEIKTIGETQSEEFRKNQSDLNFAISDLEKYKEFLVKERIMCEVCGSVIK